MKIVSWNVNGIRSVMKKGFLESVKVMDPDILCIQEIKASPDVLTNNIKNIPNYPYSYFHSSVKKGYSGTAIYSKIKPIKIIRGIGNQIFDSEGRVLTAEFEDFFVMSIYVVNSQPNFARLEIRKLFDDKLLEFTNMLEKEKPVIMTGDFNVCHYSIDACRAKYWYNKKPGFSDTERQKFDQLINERVDTWRHFHPNKVKYSWWNYRPSNIGSRLDYILVPKMFIERVNKTKIYNKIEGSDHCPVGIVI